MQLAEEEGHCFFLWKTTLPVNRVGPPLGSLRQEVVSARVSVLGTRSGCLSHFYSAGSRHFAPTGGPAFSLMSSIAVGVLGLIVQENLLGWIWQVDAGFRQFVFQN